MKKSYSVVICLLVIALLFGSFGCAKAPAPTPGLTKLKVAAPVAGQMGYAISLMKALEIDRKHGIDAELYLLGFGPCAEALRLGEVDTGVVVPSAALKMTMEGTPVKIISYIIWSGNAFLVQKDAPYNTLADLKGKKIGITSRVTGAFFFASVLAQLSGLDIEKDFDLFLGGGPALIAVLEKGEVEAVCLWEPHVSKLVATGKYRVLVDFDSEYEKLMGTKLFKAGFGARVSWLASSANAETARHWRDAVIEVCEYINERKDKDFFYENAAEIFGIETTEQMDAAWERNYAAYITGAEWTPAVVEKQKGLLQTGIELGLLPEGASVDVFWE